MQLRETIRHYILVIQHWYRLILLGVLICSGTTFGISWLLPPVYQASALIKVNATVASGSNDVFSDQALAVSYSLLVTSPDVLQEVAKKIPEVTLSQLKSSVSDSAVDNTQIIEVRAQANKPQLAATLANTVVQVFITTQAAKESASLQASAQQFLQSLALARTDVDMAQNALTTLENAHASDENLAHQRGLVETYQANYDDLQATYHQFQYHQFQSTDNLSLAQLATAPDKPMSPQIGLNTLIALIMGFVLMVVLVWMLDWADATIKTSEDVTQLAAMEPLGSVPLSKSLVTSTRTKDHPLIDHGPVYDAFITIGTNFSVLGKGSSVVMVKGVREGVGTSTVAANLAISLAQAGTRVLLIDANLRRPSLHVAFQLPNTKGLTNCLADVHLFQGRPVNLVQSWLNQWQTSLPNLWLLPSGPTVPSHMAILRMPELPMLLRWLLGKPGHINYQTETAVVDCIIFDTSALEEGADTAVLASLTDASVLVIGAGKEQKETLSKAQAMLLRLGSPILGVIINYQQAKHRPYFYVNRSQEPVTASEMMSVQPHRRGSSLFMVPSLLPESSHVVTHKIPAKVPEPNTAQFASLISRPSQNTHPSSPKLQLSMPLQPSGLLSHYDGGEQSL